MWEGVTKPGRHVIEFGILDTYKPTTMEQIQELRTANLQFIKEFEKLVDRFVKKYGVRVRR